MMATHESGSEVSLVGDRDLSRVLFQVQQDNLDETPVTCYPTAVPRTRFWNFFSRVSMDTVALRLRRPRGIVFYLGTNSPGTSTDPDDYVSPLMSRIRKAVAVGSLTQ